MDRSFTRYGGLSAMIVGVLSILYAVFYLLIARQAEFIGTFGSWLLLAASGLFTSAVYVALYLRVKGNGENGFALWALLLGVLSSFATLMHGGYQALLVNALRMANPTTRTLIESTRMLPSEADPAGLATFGVVGLVAGIFSWQILRTGTLPRALGYLGICNALLLVVLYVATAANWQPLILLSGGFTSVIVGPLWWIWIGTQLMHDASRTYSLSPLGMSPTRS